jgi:xanthine dehydrogenase accessory factor
MEHIYTELKTLIDQEIPVVLCIVTSTSGSTPRKAGSKMLVYGDGFIKGTIGGGSVEFQVIQDALKLIATGEPMVKNYHLEDDLKMHCGGTMQVYFEGIGCSPKLYIFGGGHIGKALAGYATGLGFKTTVFDQREGIFDTWDLPNVETFVGNYLQIIEKTIFDKNSYIVIVTPKHEFDETILLACAPREYAYLGMIGSKRKVAEIRNKALENNILTAEILSKIDMPIGLPFAAETPAEIAVSIAAKIIDVKNTLKKS